MSTITQGFHEVVAKMHHAAKEAGRSDQDVCLVAVSKTFPPERIQPLIDEGHRVFGENRVQEAKEKWPALKASHPDIELHLIGPLQSNKAADAVALFDVIESIDRDKIARVVSAEMTKQNRRPRLFVQVNTGGEAQKSGIAPVDTQAFVARCRREHGLEIDGLMCLPPFDENPGPHFALLAKLGAECGVENLSMGMSADFETAISFGATHIRVGSAIFGAR